MDLFGDLPTAKNSTGNSSSKQNDQTQKVTKDKSVGIPSIYGGKDKVSEKTKSTGTPGLSLKKQLGTAGTAFAFVPAALRVKKKVAVAAPNESTSKASGKKEQNNVIVKQETTDKSSINVDCKPNNSAPLDYKKQESKHTDEDEEIRQLHLAVAQVEADMDESKQRLLNLNFDYSLLDIKNYTPYDPLIPNDFLAYKEGQKKRRRRAELERSTREALRQQEVMRERIEEERRRAVASGDLNQIVRSRENFSMEIRGVKDSNGIPNSDSK